jgi:lysophospholipase L1-like esterase
LGEAVNSTVNREVQRYNEVIRKIALEEEVSFLPIYHQQVGYLLESRRTSAPEYAGEYDQIAGSLFEHLVLRKSFDEISLKNGYLLHTDGIHLNSRGGIFIAKQVEKFLNQR